ncbi:MAG TPA: hypothetical protein VGH59_12805 [Casimicrobiaceae bacterium]
MSAFCPDLHTTKVPICSAAEQPRVAKTRVRHIIVYAVVLRDGDAPRCVALALENGLVFVDLAVAMVIAEHDPAGVPRATAVALSAVRALGYIDAKAVLDGFAARELERLGNMVRVVGEFLARNPVCVGSGSEHQQCSEHRQSADQLEQIEAPLRRSRVRGGRGCHGRL